MPTGRPQAVGRARIAFLDRDGTLNVERHFLRTPEELELLPGALDAVRSLRDDLGYRPVVATNQSGIARGYLDEAGLQRIHDRLHDLLGHRIAAYLHCPHHPDGGDAPGPYHRVCRCRKPADGMFRLGLELFGARAEDCIAIGDSARDVLPPLRLGMRVFLVTTGKPVDEQLETLRSKGVANPEHLVVDDVLTAVAQLRDDPAG